MRQKTNEGRSISFFMDNHFFNEIDDIFRAILSLVSCHDYLLKS